MMIPVADAFFIDGFEELKNIGKLVINASGVNSINFWTNDIQRIIIDSAGNFGIGILSPAYLLTVANSSGGNDVNLSGVLFVNGSVKRVGIGTTGSSSELEVAGDIELTNLLDRDATNFFDNTCTTQQGMASIDSTGALTCQALSFSIANRENITEYLGGTNASRLLVKNISNILENTFQEENLSTLGAIDINTTGKLNGSRFGGKLDCSLIDGGGDGDFCNDADSGAGGGEENVWNKTDAGDVVLNNTPDNVGIGTSTPNAKLTIVGNVNISGALNLSRNLTVTQLVSCDTIDTDADGLFTCGIDADSAAAAVLHPINVSADRTQFFLNNSAANFGIGTSNPTEKLVVVGNVNISGTLNVSGVVTLKNLVSCNTTTTDANGVLSCANDVVGVTAVTGSAPITSSEGATPDIGLTLAKDIVAGTGLSGGEDNVLPGADADTTLSVDFAVTQGEATATKKENISDQIADNLSRGDLVGEGNTTWRDLNINATWAAAQDAHGYSDTNVSDVALGGGGGDIGGTIDAPTIDANAVQDDEIDYTAVTLLDFTNDRPDLFGDKNYSNNLATNLSKNDILGLPALDNATICRVGNERTAIINNSNFNGTSVAILQNLTIAENKTTSYLNGSGALGFTIEWNGTCKIERNLVSGNNVTTC